MKVLQLELENLSSLRGIHKIDLQKVFTQCGVLLIHGPTGSGKTTLLDGISLALFGRTARLGAQSEEHIMALGMGRCRATALLELHPNGKREFYSFTWEVHRARNQAQGTLGSPTYLINQLKDPDLSSHVIHSLYNSVKVKDWRTLVQELLGNLCYEDFARSCFLFQNEYSRFLRSKSTEKAALLAALTHTEYFYQIGEHISKHQNTIKIQYEKLKKQAQFFLSPEKKEKIEKTRAKQRKSLEKTDCDLELRQPKRAELKDLYSTTKNYTELLEQWYQQIEGTITPEEIKQLQLDQKIRPFEELFQDYKKRQIKLRNEKVLNKTAIPTHQKQQQIRIKGQLMALKKEGLKEKRNLLSRWMQLQLQLLPKKEEYQRVKTQEKQNQKQRQIQEHQIETLQNRKAENNALIQYASIAPELFLAFQNNPKEGLVTFKAQLQSCSVKILPSTLSGLLTTHKKLIQELIEHLSHTGANEVRLNLLLKEKMTAEKKRNETQLRIQSLEAATQLIQDQQAEIETILNLKNTPKMIEKKYHTLVQQCHNLDKDLQKHRALFEEYSSLLQLHHNLRANLSTLQISLSALETMFLDTKERKNLENKYAKAKDPKLQQQLERSKKILKKKLHIYKIKLPLESLQSIYTFLAKQKTKIEKEEQKNKALQRKRTATAQKIQQLEDQLERHKQITPTLKNKVCTLSKQLEYSRKLHQMLGMRGSGRNSHVLFEEKAQAYNLRRFIEMSNKHILSITNDRYQLQPQLQNGIPTANFCIYDSMLQGQRDISNFSGGENFLLSLGLALGIGDLQDSLEPIESLFIDEGFGTLDPESLQVVIETLNKLGQKLNKQIVIISHVPQLQEEFDVRIEVKKGEDGASILTYHGIER